MSILKVLTLVYLGGSIFMSFRPRVNWATALADAAKNEMEKWKGNVLVRVSGMLI